MKNTITILLIVIPFIITSNNRDDLVSLTDAEVELVAKVVETEARGEHFHGKYLVASTVINRLKDPRFPRTVRHVLFEPNQYARPSARFSQQSLLAVKQAIQDPYPKILYFYNPRTARNKQFTSRLSQCIVVGNHKFCSNFN